MEPVDPARHLLRHTLATLAYRGSKALRDAPAAFATFKVADTTRTPGQLLAHLGDLLDWALSMAQGQPAWRNSPPLAWEDGSKRFFAALSTLDNFLASDRPLPCPAEKLFQGPIADALTHVGQIAMLRRLAGAPIRGENYYIADIAIGCTGLDQPTPKREFD